METAANGFENPRHVSRAYLDHTTVSLCELKVAHQRKFRFQRELFKCPQPSSLANTQDLCQLASFSSGGLVLPRASRREEASSVLHRVE